MRTLVIAGIVVAASTGTALAQDAAAGEQVFKRLCSPCHDIGPEAKVKLDTLHFLIVPLTTTGMSLPGWAPVPISSVGDIGTLLSATDALIGLRNRVFVLYQQPFDKYIRAQMQEMPGTRMAFVGIKNDKDIADLWAYLKQFGPDGAKK